MAHFTHDVPDIIRNQPYDSFRQKQIEIFLHFKFNVSALKVMSRLELQHTLTGHKGRVWGADWHPTNVALATCGEDKTIRLWSQEGNRWITKTILSDSHTRTIRDVAWSPCGQFLASASFDATTAIWDKKSGERQFTIFFVPFPQSNQIVFVCCRSIRM